MKPLKKKDTKSSENFSNLVPMKSGGDWIGKATAKMEKKGTKGAFTEYCGGKVTESCIEKGLKSSDPTIRKRAAFAKAMRHVSHKKFGGDSIPGAQTDNIIQEKKDQFVDYIMKNTLKSMGTQVHEDIDSFHDHTMMALGGDGDPFGNPNALPINTPNMGQQQLMINQPSLNGVPWTYNMTNPNAPTGNQAYGYNPIMMDPSQLTNMPMTSQMSDQDLYNANGKKTSQIKHSNINGEFLANYAIAGLNGISSIFEARDRKAFDETMKKKQMADYLFPSTIGNRGDYEVNSGMFRPDQMVPIQFKGYNTGATPYSYKKGGEYYMTDSEIEAFLKDGGQIDYLD